MHRQEKTFREEPSAELDALAHGVIGAAIAVHQELGPGFLESVYEEAMCQELAARQISFRRQVVVPILYRGRMVGESRLDLVVDEQLVVELKAVEALKPIHRAQTTSYLRAGEFQLGLLINFNVPLVRDGITRIVWSGQKISWRTLLLLTSWRFLWASHCGSLIGATARSPIFEDGCSSSSGSLPISRTSSVADGE